MTDVGLGEESLVMRTKEMRCAIVATAVAGLLGCNGASLLVAEPSDAAVSVDGTAPLDASQPGNSPEDAGAPVAVAWDAAAYPFDASMDFVMGLDSGAGLADLDDAGVNGLCAWIAQQQQVDFPGPCNDQVDGGGAFVSGATENIGAPGSPPPDFGILRVCMDPPYCIRNVRQAPCSATVAELVECVHTFNAVWTEEGQTGTQTPADWSDLMAGCGAYEADPACRQTIFSFEATTCPGLLPIEPNAICN